MVFKPTDVIPIVNYAWARSFARSDCNRKAILERVVLKYRMKQMQQPKPTDRKKNKRKCQLLTPTQEWQQQFSMHFMNKEI